MKDNYTKQLEQFILESGIFIDTVKYPLLAGLAKVKIPALFKPIKKQA